MIINQSWQRENERVDICCICKRGLKTAEPSGDRPSLGTESSMISPLVQTMADGRPIPGPV